MLNRYFGEMWMHEIADISVFRRSSRAPAHVSEGSGGREFVSGEPRRAGDCGRHSGRYPRRTGRGFAGRVWLRRRRPLADRQHHPRQGPGQQGARGRPPVPDSDAVWATMTAAYRAKRDWIAAAAATRRIQGKSCRGCGLAGVAAAANAAHAPDDFVTNTIREAMALAPRSPRSTFETLHLKCISEVVVEAGRPDVALTLLPYFARDVDRAEQTSRIAAGFAAQGSYRRARDIADGLFGPRRQAVYDAILAAEAKRRRPAGQ